MTKRTAPARLPYYTAEDIAAMSDEGLADLEDILRGTQSLAFQVRTPAAARAHRRADYILERLVWPEVDRGRAAARRA
jgi:hypothetical protein